MRRLMLNWYLILLLTHGLEDLETRQILRSDSHKLLMRRLMLNWYSMRLLRLNLVNWVRKQILMSDRHIGGPGLLRLSSQSRRIQLSDSHRLLMRLSMLNWYLILLLTHGLEDLETRQILRSDSHKLETQQSMLTGSSIHNLRCLIQRSWTVMTRMR